MATPRLPSSSPPGGSQRRPPLRLWPLLFLPIVGLLAGALSARMGVDHLDPPTGFHTAVAALTGLVAGSLLMALVALGFLAARLGARQLTIRSALIAVAVVPLAMGLVRACLP
ncbi:MAG: hypothetical protein P4L84_03650 [Isosphaeraceae bacterium]|nr:hypothetical protein [Isosphaeraceae bacterium]